MGALRASGAVHRMGMEEWIRCCLTPSPAVETKRTGYQASRARILGLSGRFDEAEAVLARLPEGAWKRAALVVASAAETARPELARSLYARVADDLRRRGTKPAREELLWINERLAALG